MSFMEKQITIKQRWLRVETHVGSTEFVSVYDTGLDIPNGNDFDSPDIAKNISQYTEDKPEIWENIKGYGARLSAPSYLNCTEWAVFETEEEAEDYLEENYPEYEEDESEENNVS